MASSIVHFQLGIRNPRRHCAMKKTSEKARASPLFLSAKVWALRDSPRPKRVARQQEQSNHDWEWFVPPIFLVYHI